MKRRNEGNKKERRGRCGIICINKEKNEKEKNRKRKKKTKMGRRIERDKKSGVSVRGYMHAKVHTFATCTTMRIFCKTAYAHSNNNNNNNNNKSPPFQRRQISLNASTTTAWQSVQNANAGCP